MYTQLPYQSDSDCLLINELTFRIKNSVKIDFEKKTTYAVWHKPQRWLMLNTKLAL